MLMLRAQVLAVRSPSAVSDFLLCGSLRRLCNRAAAEPAAGDLPLKRVVLFSSGVGFFEHSGEIDGDRTIEMRFDTAAINDLLKSMVVQDFGDGHISTVTYGSARSAGQAIEIVFHRSGPQPDGGRSAASTAWATPGGLDAESDRRNRSSAWSVVRFPAARTAKWTRSTF